jgi:hypothetical protein
VTDERKLERASETVAADQHDDPPMSVVIDAALTTCSSPTGPSTMSAASSIPRPSSRSRTPFYRTMKTISVAALAVTAVLAVFVSRIVRLPWLPREPAEFRTGR